MNRLVSELLSQFGSLRIEALHQRALESRTRTTSSTTFPHRNTLSTRKPDSLLREKRNTVVILVRGFAKCRQNISRTRYKFGIFRSAKRLNKQ